MKEEYSIRLRCATCGCEDNFEFNDDQSYIKCTFCNREYFGGIDELQELNLDLINELKKDIIDDIKQHLNNKLEKTIKDNKFIKIELK